MRGGRGQARQSAMRFNVIRFPRKTPAQALNHGCKEQELSQRKPPLVRIMEMRK